MNLEEFLKICDEKRKDNIYFDLGSTFKSLDSAQQEEILTSINDFKLLEVSRDAPRDPAEFAQQETYRGLKALLAHNNALQGSEEEILYFKEDELIEGENKLLDISGDKKKINKKGEEFYIDGQKCDIKHEQGHLVIEYQVKYNIESQFLRNLETSYYQRCSRNNSLFEYDMAKYGMLTELAEVENGQRNPPINDNSITTSINRKGYLCINGKSSLLHLTVQNMLPERLKEVIDSMPYGLRIPYLLLRNSKGQTVADMVPGDRAEIINSYTRHVQQRHNLENFSQNVHIRSIHSSVDESFVKIANDTINGDKRIENNGRRITFDHEEAIEFIDERMQTMKAELEALKSLSEKELFEKYIKPTLPPFQQKEIEEPESLAKKTKLIKFTHFQIKKSAELIDDVINHGHIGDKYEYTFDVNRAMENGFTTKEMMALAYSASKNEDKLVRAGRDYRELESLEQKLCKIEAQMKLISGLYSMRRGYNIDHGHDNIDEHKFSPDIDDESVCRGGTINRLGDALNSVHSDVEIRVVDPESIKKKIQLTLPDLINNMIDQERSKEDELSLVMDIKNWQETNKIPDRLQVEISQTLCSLLDENHQIIQEFAKDFSQSEISGNIARNALKNYKYPVGQIRELATLLKPERDADIIAYYKENPYMKNVKGEYTLTLDHAVQHDPR